MLVPQPLDPQDMGLALWPGQHGLLSQVLSAVTCGLSRRVQSVWSQSGPKLGRPPQPGQGCCDPLLGRCRAVCPSTRLPAEIAYICLLEGHGFRPRWYRLRVLREDRAPLYEFMVVRSMVVVGAGYCPAATCRRHSGPMALPYLCVWRSA
jgi:hypothetical protein